MEETIPSPMEIGIQPEEVFAEVWTELKKQNRGEYPLGLRRLHKAFWEAKEQYPVVMQGFGCEGSAGEPYLYELTECIDEFRQEGLLALIPGKGITIIGDKKKLENIFEKRAEVEETAKYICDRL
jgi:hypothetical protein